MDTLNIREVQQQIGTLRKRGHGREPFAVTSRGKVVLVCIPVADPTGPWAGVWQALQARIACKDARVPDLGHALDRLRWFLKVGGLS